MIEIKYWIHNNKNKIKIYIKNKNKKCGYTNARAPMFQLVLCKVDCRIYTYPLRSHLLYPSSF